MAKKRPSPQRKLPNDCFHSDKSFLSEVVCRGWRKNAPPPQRKLPNDMFRWLLVSFYGYTSKRNTRKAHVCFCYYLFMCSTYTDWFAQHFWLGKSGDIFWFPIMPTGQSFRQVTAANTRSHTRSTSAAAGEGTNESGGKWFRSADPLLILSVA